MKILPIVMVKNEERWIGRVLLSLSILFPHVIVADTGSTDGTLEEIRNVPRTVLMSYIDASMEEVGGMRGEMQKVAKGLGATHVMLVDGDELYPTRRLKHILNHPMADTMMGGYTFGLEVKEMEDGSLWIIEGGLWNRMAVFSVNSKWSGTYPFESPNTFQTARADLNHYWLAPFPDACHFYHVHQTTRSSKDADVHLREFKKNKYSMQERPDLTPTRLWLKSEKEYRDEPAD